MDAKTRERLETKYEHQYLETQGALEALAEAVADLPAPGDDDNPIDWGHLGTLCEARRQIEETLAFLTSAE